MSKSLRKFSLQLFSFGFGVLVIIGTQSTIITDSMNTLF